MVTRVGRGLVLAVLMFGLISCGPSAIDVQKSSRIAQIDSSLNEVYSMLNRAGLTIGQPDVIMITFLLKQQFNLNFTFPTVPSFYEKRPFLQERYFKLYDYYFDGKDYVNYTNDEVNAYIDESVDTDLNALTFWSMYCNKFPLDERFFSVISSKIDNPPPYPDLTDKSIPPPEYWVLHAALQLQGAQNGGCLEQSNEVNELWSRVENGLVQISNGKIETKQYDQDILTESLAMLYYTGQDKLVSEEHIDDLLSNQLVGGGWSFSTGSENVSLHTSVLAMWVLLEYRESLQNSLKS